MFVSDEHFENAESPIYITLSGIITQVSDEHPQNTPNPIYSTLFGILMLVLEF